MNNIKHIDYVGFTFNGIHSSELGIKRTSDGSRFNENLLPPIEDKTVEIPGGDGAYYFGSYYKQRVFDIPYAFDSLTEEQLARIKTVFGDKKIHDLIFDEAPYKVYKAKITETATIKYIPFNEGETNRVYKGEGTIQFTAFDPYARSVYKYADQYEVENFEEWKKAANLLDSQGDFDKLIVNNIKLYNPGVKESDFILTLKFNSYGKIPAGKIFIDADSQLNFKEFVKQGNDTQIKINSKLNLIEGYYEKDGKLFKSGNIYNKDIESGVFFKIPKTVNVDDPLTLTLTSDSDLSSFFVGLEYDYYYF